MESLDDKTLVKKTLLTVAAMVGACVVIVGSLSLVALLVVGRATRAPDADDRTPALAPAGVGPASPDGPSRSLSSPPSPKAPAKSNQI